MNENNLSINNLIFNSNTIEMYNNDNSDNEIETNSQVENLNNLLFNVNSDKEEIESSEEYSSVATSTQKSEFISNQDSNSSNESNYSINSEETDESNISNNLETSDYQNHILQKYNNLNLRKIKLSEEINILQQKKNRLELFIYKNDFISIKKIFNNGFTLNRIENNNVVKLCKNISCQNKCTKECYKNYLYSSLFMFNRGIKTIYHNLFLIILKESKFRSLCKCCEIHNEKIYLNNMEKKFINNKFALEDNNSFDEKKLKELQINYLINKFMYVIGLLPCECKFKNKYYNFYDENYFNFDKVIKIYIKTIPTLIKLLKNYYEINTNDEELNFIKEKRCIHEDIRFNNLTYCRKKIYKECKKSDIIELIMNLDLLNEWLLNFSKILIYFYNQQSLEHFRYYMFNNKKKISEQFKKIYNIKNEFLNLNFISNNIDIVSSLLEYYNKINENEINQLIKNIIKQLEYKEKDNLNYILIENIIKCFKNENYELGFKILKYLKNLKLENNQNKLEFIFNTILNNGNIKISEKISNLKIINKNKINVIEYDFVEKLLNNNDGDKIILEFNRDENNLFKIEKYKNEEYIINTIKKCIINQKNDILDYVLYNLSDLISKYKINIILLYLLIIPKKVVINGRIIDNEYKYIESLRVIVNYLSKLPINISYIENNNTINISIIEYCINNDLTYTGKILLDNKLEVLDNYKILKKCIDKKNHIILEGIINRYPMYVNLFIEELTIVNYLFKKFTKNEIENNTLIRFLKKILKCIINNKIKNRIINFQDKNNELLGFKILNSNIKEEHKIILFNFIKDIINPLEINKYVENLNNYYNYPIILHSVLLNEYEISFLLLNNLIKNNKIKKFNNNNTIFDYYHLEENININFVPIIFKFIKDNHSKYNNFDENNLTNIDNYLTIDKEAILFILKIISYVIFFSIINKNSYESFLPINNITINIETDNDNLNDFIKKEIIYKKDNNKNDNNKNDNLINNHYLELSIDNTEDYFLDTNNDNKSKNKNIWLEKKEKKKIIDKKNTENSDISESEILFDNN